MLTKAEETKPVSKPIPEEAARIAMEVCERVDRLAQSAGPGMEEEQRDIGRHAREALRLAEPVPACCADCGKPYSDFPLDTTLPHDQWERIMGSPNGLLCANCMVARASKLPGAVAVRMTIDCDAAEPEPDLAEEAAEDYFICDDRPSCPHAPLRLGGSHLAWHFRTAINKALERERAAVAERDRERVEAVREMLAPFVEGPPGGYGVISTSTVEHVRRTFNLEDE